MIFKNKVFHCDNLELLQNLPDECIDLVYCDVLYGTGRDFGSYQDLKADRKIFTDFYSPRITEIYRVLKSTGSIYIHCDSIVPHYLKLLMDSVFDLRNFHNEILWCYTRLSRATIRYPRKYDILLFYTKSEQCTFNIQKLVPEKEIRKDWWTDIPGLSIQAEYSGYPTQKPEKLLRRIIEVSSNRGDLVADFFCGSGTTGVVCIDLDRNYLLCDIGEEAIRLTGKRLAAVKKRRDRQLF